MRWNTFVPLFSNSLRVSQVSVSLARPLFVPARLVVLARVRTSSLVRSSLRRFPSYADLVNFPETSFVEGTRLRERRPCFELDRHRDILEVIISGDSEYPSNRLDGRDGRTLTVLDGPRPSRPPSVQVVESSLERHGYGNRSTEPSGP